MTKTASHVDNASTHPTSRVQQAVIMLAAFDTRAAATDYLTSQRLLKADLLAVGGQLQVAVTIRQRKADILRTIVDATAGTREDAAAIRGYSRASIPAAQTSRKVTVPIRSAATPQTINHKQLPAGLALHRVFAGRTVAGYEIIHVATGLALHSGTFTVWRTQRDLVAAAANLPAIDWTADRATVKDALGDAGETVVRHLLQPAPEQMPAWEAERARAAARRPATQAAVPAPTVVAVEPSKTRTATARVTPTPTLDPTVDLDTLAYDIADALDRGGYGIDVADCHLRPHLEAFLTAALATAAADVDTGGDAATWTAADANSDAEPVPQQTRRPRMTYVAWHRSQLVELGAVTIDAWYWQCPTTGCKVWAGPYSDPMAAKRAGFDHVYQCEKTDYYRRSRRAGHAA